jgi:hypothetical protein
LGTFGDVTHVPFKFEQFSDELASILNDVEPNQIATRCAEVVQHRRSRKTKIAIKSKIGILKANTKKSFTAMIDAYLHSNQKPASIRVWLEADCKTHDGTVQHQFSDQFLESPHILVGEGLSGLVRKEVPIKFTVPEYSDWVAHANKVSLHVAIVKNTVERPTTAKEPDVLAKDSRTLSYTG